jgi:hypothetical protein
MSIRSLGAAAAAATTVSLLLLWLGAPQQTWRTWRIYNNTGTTIGLITDLDCNNHGTLSYSFEVDGVRHLGRSPNFHGDCRELKSGQRVLVHYEEGAPATNLATVDDRRGRDPSTMLRNEILASLVMFVVILFSMLLAAYFLARKVISKGESVK